MSAWQDAIRQDPNFADPYLALGKALRKLGQPQDAVNTYRKLLRAQPNNVDGYIALGSALAEMGQFAQAEAPLRRALAATPRTPRCWPSIHNNLAIVLSQLEPARRSAGKPGTHPKSGAGSAQPGPATHRPAAPVGPL